MRGRFLLFALALFASGCSKPAPHDDTDRDDDGDAHRTTSTNRNEVDGASLDRALSAYRQATGRDLSMRDAVRRRTDCLTFTMKLEADDADALDRAFQQKLAEKGLRVEERSGLRTVTRDDKQPSPCPASASSAPLRARRPAIGPRSGGSGLIDEDILQRIDEVSPDHFRIEQAALDAIFEPSFDRFARSLRVVPNAANGKARGLRLYAIRSESVTAHLGLKNGDTVLSANGIALDAPDHVIEAYAKLKQAQRFDIELERRGEEVHIDIEVVPDGSIAKQPLPSAPSAASAPSASPATPGAAPALRRPTPVSPSPMRPGTP
jgi:hypothetical protein